MATTAYFSNSYRDARQEFLTAANDCKAAVTSRACPEKGPSNEDLFVDIARVGDAGAKRVLVIISGTHGVEGFCGSACQTAWLRTDAELRDPTTAVYLIHAINPYGFAWLRRVNENNVDLNRNFIDFGRHPLPANPEYKEIEHLLNPRTRDQHNLRELDPGLKGWFGSPEKVRAFKAAVGRGQYEFPKGIVFGGRSPTWSHLIVREFIRSLPSPLEVGVVLDIHTGLGDLGQLEIFTEETGAKYDILKDWLRASKVTTLGDSVSLGYRITGSVYQAFTTVNTDSPWHCVALEFGTQPLVHVLLALQADNWLHCFADRQNPLLGRVQGLMKDAFSVSSTQWQDQVVNRALEVISNASSGIRHSFRR